MTTENYTKGELEDHFNKILEGERFVYDKMWEGIKYYGLSIRDQRKRITYLKKIMQTLNIIPKGRVKQNVKTDT